MPEAFLDVMNAAVGSKVRAMLAADTPLAAEPREGRLRGAPGRRAVPPPGGGRREPGRTEPLEVHGPHGRRGLAPPGRARGPPRGGRGPGPQGEGRPHPRP